MNSWHTYIYIHTCNCGRLECVWFSSFQPALLSLPGNSRMPLESSPNHLVIFGGGQSGHHSSALGNLLQVYVHSKRAQGNEEGYRHGIGVRKEATYYYYFPVTDFWGADQCPQSPSMVGGLLIPGDTLHNGQPWIGSKNRSATPRPARSPPHQQLLLLALVKFWISFLTLFYLIKEDRLYIYAFWRSEVSTSMSNCTHKTRSHETYYRNSIAGSPHGEQIFIYFEKIRFASQKLNFLIFVFSKNKSVKMTSNSLEVTKCCKKLIYFIFILFVFKFLLYLLFCYFYF